MLASGRNQIGFGVNAAKGKQLVFKELQERGKGVEEKRPGVCRSSNALSCDIPSSSAVATTKYKGAKTNRREMQFPLQK